MKGARPDWSGKTCVILASGPSLRAHDCVTVLNSGAHVIAVNTTFRLAPQADVLYAGDFLWHKVNHSEYVKTFKGQVWTGDSTAAERYGINRIKCVNRPGLGLTNLHANGNSGFQSLNLAFLFGCRRILLLGFDMKPGSRGEKHWHPDHPGPLMQAQCFDEWVHKSALLAKDLEREGCEVVNCSRDTALTCFPRSTIEKEL